MGLLRNKILPQLILPTKQFEREKICFVKCMKVLNKKMGMETIIPTNFLT